MKCRILHESNGRMRVHICKVYMTGKEADILEVYLRNLSGVMQARVDERTGNAVLYYKKTQRDTVCTALSTFDFETTEIEAPDHSSREISRAYEDKLFFHVVKRLITKYVLPRPISMAITAVSSVPYLIKGLRSLLRRKVEVAMLDAVSIGASLARNEFDTASSVMFLLGVGDIMEEWTHQKSVADLAAAMSLSVDKVWTLTEQGDEVLVGIDQVKSGDTIVVRTGNMIPLDGVVLSGEAMINQATITGEPLPVAKTAGSYIYAGTAVEEGEIRVTVKNAAGKGRYDRIVAMIEQSEKLKSETEDKAFHLADRLVPWTFAATGLTYLLTRNAARATSILMVDFCCALKLAMPITVLSAMKESRRYSISVKGGKYIENFSEAQTIVFDKTGTLTKAEPHVHAIVPFGGNDEVEMLRLSACLEEHYPHSIATAVMKEAKERGIEHKELHSKVEYIVAHGIVSSIGDQRVCIGSHHFIFDDEKCSLPADEQEKFDALPNEFSHLYMALDGKLAAVILIEDPIKDGARKVIGELHKLGIDNVVMMTGDSERTAKAVAKISGVDTYCAEVLPEDKAEFIRKEHEKGRKVIMVGDGVNDSPALSEADAGVAMNSGAAIAREIADITISEQDLHSLITMKRLSDTMMARIHRNYTSIIAINSLLMALGAGGIMTGAMTAFWHNMSTIAIALHSMTDLLPLSEIQ